MRHLLGIDSVQWDGSGRADPVIVDFNTLVNGHSVFAAMSGKGKSHQIARLLKSAARQGILCDVIDPHDELADLVAGGQGGSSGLVSSAKFSESRSAGYNPLVINPDPHSGGVHRQISVVLETIARSGRELGTRQAYALKCLLLDVYELRGIYPNDPSTWKKREMTEAMYDDFCRRRDYQGMRAYYPILRDVISYAERKLKALITGGDSKSITALEMVERSQKRISSLSKKYANSIDDGERERIEADHVKAREKAIEAYAIFVNSMETGKESSDVVKFTDKDTLVSITERLHELSRGIFCSNPPRWDDAARVRVHEVMSLSDADLKMLVYTRAHAILRECMDMGITDTVRRIFLLDEAHRFYSDKPDDPLNRIAKEGRKFGLSLVMGSQSPTHFSEDFLTNVSCMVILGIHDKFWGSAVKQLGIDLPTMQKIKAREVVALRLQLRGETSGKFRLVNVSDRVLLSAREQLLARG